MTAFFKFHSALRARHVLGPKPDLRKADNSYLVHAQGFYLESPVKYTFLADN